MSSLFRLVTLRYAVAARGRSALTLFGVVLGVAVLFAIEVVNGSVMASFAESIDVMAGKSALVVGEGTGTTEELLDAVRGVEGVRLAVPVIRESVRDRNHSTQLSVLAIDALADGDVRDYAVSGDDVAIEDELSFLNDPRAVLVTEQYAKRVGLQVGDTLTLATAKGDQEFNVRGTLAPRGAAQMFGGDLLLMDVFAAQIAFDRGRHFDFIDVVPEDGADVDVLAAAISSAINDAASVRRPQQRTEEVEKILSGFQLGLALASLVAMFVGGFIVYNSLAISVAQRRREVGILRALGATRRQVILVFMAEGLLFGAVGAAAGIGLGILLGAAALAAVGDSISAVFMHISPETLAVEPQDAFFGLTMGIGVALFAAVFPARRASLVSPVDAMQRRGTSVDVAPISARGALIASSLFLVASGVLGVVAHVRQDFVLGGAVCGLLALSCASLAPLFTRGVAVLGERLVSIRHPALRLGVVGFARNTQRNAVAIAALGLALANVVNIGSFLGSVKQNTVDWFERTLRADLVVFAGSQANGKFEQPFPVAVADEVSKVPGVAFADPFRMVRKTFRDEPFYLLSYDLPRYVRYNDIPVVAGDLESALPRIVSGEGIAASETFTRQFGMGLGDSVTLATVDGPRSFRIELVYLDYSAELGILTTTREVYAQAFNDTRIDSIGVYAEEGVSTDAIRESLVTGLASQHELTVLHNAEYREQILRVFDRSFVLMRAMEVVAILVALLGIVNTLVVSVIDRTSELGVLKAVGAVRTQVARMVLVEAAMVGMASVVLSLIGGMAFSLYTIKELLPLQMGWNIVWRPSAQAVVEVVLAAVVVAWAGAWIPARAAARLRVVTALAHE